MARLPRGQQFTCKEVEVAHIWNRVVRQCFLLGRDPISGKNYDYRKGWIVDLLNRYASYFGIDLLEYALMSNHFHAVLRSRPDVVKKWYDIEIAFRWLMICPKRKKADGTPEAPSEAEINAIVNNGEKLLELRRRLSDMSWWVRLLCQRIAQRANAEDEQEGKFWQARFKATKLEDEASLLACSAYVNLNPIRAALAEKIEETEFTSIKQRLIARRFQESMRQQGKPYDENQLVDCHLAPLAIDEAKDPVGPVEHKEMMRCSDKGYLPITLEAYVELLDWSARRRVAGKAGCTPDDAPPVLERLGMKPNVWQELIENFPRLRLAKSNNTITECKPRLLHHGKKTFQSNCLAENSV